MSDSHGRSGKVKKMIEANKDADGIIYLGDGEKDLESANRTVAGKRKSGELSPADYELARATEPAFLYQVRGNCDRDSKEVVTLIKEIEGVQFYITHGYEQGVKYGLEKLAAFAKEEGCQVALFGHTHGMHYSIIDGVELFNPGSAANGNYGVITIKSGKAKFEHKEL